MKLSKKQAEKEPWQIAASRYFVENSEEGFTNDGYRKFVKSRYNVSEQHLTQFFNESILNPSGRQHQRRDFGGGWIPPLEMVSTITDYDELVEARKNARQAFRLSIIAIIISVVTLLVSIFSGDCLKNLL